MAEQALDLLLAEEQGMMRLIGEFHATRSEVDKRSNALYQARVTPIVEAVEAIRRS
jgi:hypothetical protein